jgi:hypothetical protein
MESWPDMMRAVLVHTHKESHCIKKNFGQIYHDNLTFTEMYYNLVQWWLLLSALLKFYRADRLSLDWLARNFPHLSNARS